MVEWSGRMEWDAVAVGVRLRLLWVCGCCPVVLFSSLLLWWFCLVLHTALTAFTTH